jgi:hypothetical protein
VCVCVCACVRECMRACVRACVRASARVCVCVHARMCVTFARIMLMHINVKIFSALRSRPLTQVSFPVPDVSITF